VWATTTDEVVDALAEELKTVLGFPQTAIYFLDASQQPAHSVLWEHRGNLPTVPRVPVEGDLILIEVFQATEPVVVADARTDHRTNKEVIETKGCRTLVFLPILLSDGVRAFVSTGTFGDVSWEPGDESLDYLAILGHHLSLALDRLLISTERKVLAAEFSHAQKMEMLARMAGAGAHELRNLLTAISGHTSLLTESIGKTAPGWEPLKMENATAKASQVVQALLAFSRRQPQPEKSLSFNDIIDDMKPMLSSLPEPDTKLIFKLDPQLRFIRGDRSQLEQLLVHLVNNSVEAMDQAGEITLTTTNSGPRFSHEQQRDWIELTVKDTGHGMACEVAHKAFDPFFSTKNNPRNPGLGLSTCYGIVRQMRGHIWLRSEPGKDTTVTINLPAEVLVEREKPPGKPTLVLLERRPSSVRSVLQPLPLEIRTVHSVDQAVQQIGDPSVQLLVAEATFWQSGRLEEKIAAVRQDLPTLYLADDSTSTPPGDVLEYPFTADELWSSIGSLCDDSAPPQAKALEGNFAKVLVGLSAKLLLATNVCSVLSATKAVINQELGYEPLWLYLASEDLKESFVWWQLEGEERWEPRNIPTNEGSFIQEILRCEGPVVSDDALTDPRTNKSVVKMLDLRTTLNVPFRLIDGRVGCLGTGTFGDEVRPPNPDQVDFLAAVASLAVVSLERLDLLAERKRVRRAFLRGQHMEATTRLGKGLADDIRNALAAIDGFTHLAQSSLQEDDPAQKILQKIERTSRSAAQLVEKMLAFTRAPNPSLADFDLNPLIHSLGPLLKKLCKDQAVTLQTCREPCLVRFDWEEMEQIILNLVLNSRDAGAKQIDLRTKVVDAQIELEVRDNGCGMAPETVTRAFEPFFTTKSESEGTGLGLATCRRLVRRVGGSVHLQSHLGDGTLVQLRLPRQ
jgi:signal transduction histidine kinase